MIILLKGATGDFTGKLLIYRRLLKKSIHFSLTKMLTPPRSNRKIRSFNICKSKCLEASCVESGTKPLFSFFDNKHS